MAITTRGRCFSPKDISGFQEKLWINKLLNMFTLKVSMHH